MKIKRSGIERGLEFVAEHTWQLKERLWMENLAVNMPLILVGRDIRELPKCGGSAVVVGAGPSVKEYNQLGALEGSGYSGTIIATDRMLKPCLESGVIPQLVMTADGDQSIAGFYDGVNEVVRSVFKFPDLAAKRTSAVLNALTVHPDTVAKCPYEKFWYVTAVDNPLGDRSVTRAVHFMTKKTILSSFGNVGGEAVNLAMFLGANPVIMVGMDYGYPLDLKLEQTSYYGPYAELAKRRGERLEDYFTRVDNPDTGNSVMVDMNWAVYREIFLRHMRMMKKKARVINCSPVSSLFGEGIEFMPLEEALKKWPS